MNDRFKFRAWDKEKECWIWDTDKEPFSIIGEITVFEVLRGYQILEYNNIHIEQCTGLKDIEGNLVFDGDIVKGICSENPSYVCEGLKLRKELGKSLTGFIGYSEVYAQFNFSDDGIVYLDLFRGLQKIEKLGNIHDNPELLKK